MITTNYANKNGKQIKALFKDTMKVFVLVRFYNLFQLEEYFVTKNLHQMKRL